MSVLDIVPAGKAVRHGVSAINRRPSMLDFLFQDANPDGQVINRVHFAAGVLVAMLTRGA